MKKILIIDDEVKIRNVYRDVLTREGFKVLDAQDAEQGIAQIFKNNDIDLVLLDINIPRNNSHTIMDMRKDCGLPFKVIVSSVYSVDEQKHSIPSADDYYDKAQGIDILINKTKNILGGSI